MSEGLRIAFGRGVCGSLPEAAAREWLVTDGVGGYACGTVAMLQTRRYHGLLMVPTAPAGASRMLGLSALDAAVVVGDRRIRLSTHEWAGGAIDPHGYQYLAGFDLDDGLPRWRYDLGAVQVEVELAMAYGTSAVGVVYRLLAGDAHLEATALCTWRDQHGERFAAGEPRVEITPSGFVFESAYRVDGPGYRPGGAWYGGVHHREEAARGLGAEEDLWAAGTFSGNLRPGEALAISASAHLGLPPPDPVTLVATARARALTLTARSGGPRDDIDRILVTAADRFVVQTPTGPTAVAGYPWFGEWSRDLFTSYEGLFLCTGRADEGRGVLTRAAGTVSEGMLANTADVGTLEYNTVDATLWFLHAIGRHVTHTGDLDLAAELADTVAAILAAHRAGTRFGIAVDPETSLLRSGATGWALTWMDARVDGQPVTPRAGFPVEIQALWINALATSTDLLRRVGRPVDEWQALHRNALSGFRRSFPVGSTGLADVVDHAGAASTELRPNQLLAVSLPNGPVRNPDEMLAVVRACQADLLTSVGVRTLAPSDAAYLGCHRGSPADRDRAYHQGTVWPWLIGPHADAVHRSGEDPSGVLRGLELHLGEFGLGSVSETLDADEPHAATGCPFQAWSVAELIRARSAVDPVPLTR